MAAFSRGTCLLSYSNPTSLCFRNSLSPQYSQLLGPSSIQTCRFSISFARSSRLSPLSTKHSRKAKTQSNIDDRVATLKAQVQTQGQLEAKAAAERESLNRLIKRNRQAQGVDQNVLVQTTSDQPAPSNPLKATTTTTTTTATEEEEPRIITRSTRRPTRTTRKRGEEDILLKTEASRILDRGDPVILYIGPNRRWHLSIASALVFSMGAFMIGGTYWAFWDVISDDRNYNLVVSIMTAGVTAVAMFALWGAIRRRALMVSRIMLVPRTYGASKVFEVHVTGTGFVPFTKQTLVAPIWEVSTDRALENAFLPPRSEVNLQEYFNGLRPFVWFWHSVKGVFREMRYVILSSPHFSKNSVLLKLWMQENGNRLNYWLLDSRAKALLGGQAGFDYFIRPRKD